MFETIQIAIPIVLENRTVLTIEVTLDSYLKRGWHLVAQVEAVDGVVLVFEKVKPPLDKGLLSVI
jgi:hypothetical protein